MIWSSCSFNHSITNRVFLSLMISRTFSTTVSISGISLSHTSYLNLIQFNFFEFQLYVFKYFSVLIISHFPIHTYLSTNIYVLIREESGVCKNEQKEEYGRVYEHI
ncbi:hypothetical protein VIGAN_01263100 [Vigna angularis var. angularis]|uniref:Uncharacterized protein n=1 Tax=Vigna angularis var. angularis TaxID=157739 RepID=A0A0S3R2K8_PHAAN|nr:hypothetical protein VIGAN_01263100 [Vigna angularis var. angularis]